MLACVLVSRGLVWLTGLPSSVLVIATPLPGGGGAHEGRDLLQHVELTWGALDKPPQASIMGMPAADALWYLLPCWGTSITQLSNCGQTELMSACMEPSYVTEMTEQCWSS